MLYSVEMGKNIAKLRRARGLTREDLARGAGISVSYLRDIEHGRADPYLDTLESISAELRVSLPVLFLLSKEDEDILEIVRRSRPQGAVEPAEGENGHLF